MEHYGNIVTTILAPPQQRKSSCAVELVSFKNNLNYRETFEEAKEGEIFVMTGSRNTLELAVKNGSAAAVVKAKVGDKARIR